MSDEERAEDMVPCEQQQNISSIRSEQQEIRKENAEIIHNQKILVNELKESFLRLEKILLADVEHKKDIQQLKKESDLLFEKTRLIEQKVDAIEVRNARCDGAGIFENFPRMFGWYQQQKALPDKFDKVWNWYQQEQGWRRFIPAVMAMLAWLATMYEMFNKQLH